MRGVNDVFARESVPGSAEVEMKAPPAWLYSIEVDDLARFRDHLRFLVMVAIYSGFWILYFQTFGSVLWYLRDVVDKEPVSAGITALLHAIGLDVTFRFDIEHVTVINAGTLSVSAVSDSSASGIGSFGARPPRSSTQILTISAALAACSATARRIWSSVVTA